MKTIIILFTITLSINITACSGEDYVCPTLPKPKQTMIIRDTFEFGVHDGYSGPGQCGLYLVASLKRDGYITGRYKPIEIPNLIVNTWKFSNYSGVLEVLPEEFICINGAPDWKGEPIPDTMHYCRIIEYSKK